MRYRGTFGLALIVFAGMAVSSCNRASTSIETPQPYASIQELMLNVVDPAADEIWESVSYTSTRQATIDRKPTSDEEWTSLRNYALLLAEAPNLLVVPERPVAVKGGKVMDEGTPGIQTTLQIQAAIANDPGRFAAAARKLQDTAKKMIVALDAKSPEQVEAVGSELDAACESCHKQYWYPPVK